ncbi:MAG: FGGY-family carbohydrate kinase [Christensenellales bacterium]|jgi:xylulokinase
MANQYVVGIDAGTTGCRTVIFDLQGNEIGSGYRENPLIYPQAGWVELGVQDIIDNCYASTREALTKTGIDPKEIASISFTYMRPVVCLRGEDGSWVRDIQMWQDMRAAQVFPWMTQRLAEFGMTPDDLYDITGFPYSTVWMLGKICWIQQNEPDVWARVKHIHNLHGVLVHAYGCEEWLENSEDLGWWQLNNCDDFTWNEKLCKVFQVDPSMLPKHVPTGTVIGAVSREVAQKTGLAEGTPLVAGLGDQQCAAVGMGNIREGMASLVLGTAGVLVCQSEKPVRDPNRKAHVIGSALHKWEMEGHSSAAASSFKWIRQTFGHMEQATSGLTGIDVNDLLTAQAAKAKPGAQGLVYIPWLAGAAMPYYDTNARGAFIGMTFGHRKCEILRAGMEGVCCEMRTMLEAIQNAGVAPSEYIRIGGGAARSSLWNQISADVYGVPVETVKTPESTALGAAMMGAIGVGIFKDLKEASEAMVHVTGRWEPIPQNVEVYNEIYQIFLNSYTALKEQVFPAIARFQGV